MRTILKTIIIGIVCFTAVVVSACHDEMEKDETVDRTLLMFMPWTGNLTETLAANVKDMEAVIASKGLGSQRVVVYFATSSTESTLFEIVPTGGKTVRNTLKTYTNLDITTADGIASLLGDVKTLSPSRSYSMVTGCHGYGWLPKSLFGTSTSAQRSIRQKSDDAGYPTRFFGGSNRMWQIDITDFVDGVNAAGLHFDYIAFDVCYMASIEAIYDMRTITDYIVASPCEILAEGLPYSTVGAYLLGAPDLKSVCSGFYSFYSNYRLPYGTLSLIDCTQVDALAAVMKRINAQCTISDEALVKVQQLDYFNPVIFYDLGDYVARMVGDNTELLDEFNTQLAKTVVYEVHTPYYYTSAAGRAYLANCSGVSVSDPSTHRYTSTKETTAWWEATH